MERKGEPTDSAVALLRNGVKETAVYEEQTQSADQHEEILIAP
jgi:hypothetical protein